MEGRYGLKKVVSTRIRKTLLVKKEKLLELKYNYYINIYYITHICCR